MTIGIGFKCADGIVICADTQITYPGSHKYYASKILRLETAEWTAILSWAGSKSLADTFRTKFTAKMAKAVKSATLQVIIKEMEAVLKDMRHQFASDLGGLALLGALAVPNDGITMVKAEQQNVSVATDYDYVGIGDSALLRYLGDLICQKTSTLYTTDQGFILGTYLIQQAKKYVDGCGGDTEIIILWPNGHCDVKTASAEDLEQQISKVHKRLGVAASMCFDKRVPDEILRQNWAAVFDLIKQQGSISGTQP